jgi:uncharacterized protein (TIGR03000 family)
MYSVVLVVALAGSAEAPDCHRCQGGYGGCYGGSYGGCYGGGYGGCYGGFRGHGCFGGGGYGGCYGGGYGGCYGGGYGGCYGGGYGGCYGGGYGGCYGGTVIIKKDVEKIKDMPKVDKDKDKDVAAPANIVVSLPAGAKLSVDGYVTTQTSSTRYLVTPTLQPGQDYTYTLVAETTQNGQPVQQSQKIVVRAGATTPVSFTFSSTPAAASR